MVVSTLQIKSKWVVFVFDFRPYLQIRSDFWRTVSRYREGSKAAVFHARVTLVSSSEIE